MFKDYNMNQIILPLDLEIKLQENDIAFAIHQLVESIPNEAFASFIHYTGCPSYHPRVMWLPQGYGTSYRTINCFRVHPEMKELIRQCFVQFRCQLVHENLIDQETIFIDGTKIEANANKFTFVWKKSIEKYHASLIEKSNKLYEELLQNEIIPEIE